MNRRWSVMLSAAAAVCLSAGAVEGAILELTAFKDSTARSGSFANTTHGTEHRVSVKNNPGAVGDFTRKSWIAFDLSTLNPSGVVLGGSLLVQFESSRDAGNFVPSGHFELGVFGLTNQALDGWDETTLTWNNAPANLNTGGTVDPNQTVFLGSLVVPAGSYSAGQIFEVPLDTDDLAAFLADDTTGIATLILVGMVPTDGNFHLASREAVAETALTTAPTLRLDLLQLPDPTVIPEPGSLAVWLLALAALGVCGRRRRR